ncbi:hypothetical protein ACIRQH_35045 [Streptomyces sp. NPDC102279]|uniref:hypothetical protein n=1 Tax=Streptomyces sp. NPDC102279 TaxID=3366153 RepID=UPI00380DE9B2
MAADEYIIQTVSEYWPNPVTPCWAVDMIKPDGTGHRHIFPKVTLEFRAAEYGIDPTDVDTLLDIVLHEPYAPHPDDPLKGEDPAATAGLLSPALVSRGTARKGDLIPTTLYTAPDVATAREAHLLRVEHGKANNVRVSVGKGKKDPLDVIRRNHGIDPGRVADKVRRIEQRRLIAQGRAPQPPSVPDLVVKDDHHA